MRTRTPQTPKPAATAKKTPPARKSATRTPPNTADPAPESATPKSTETKRASAAKAKQIKTTETTPSSDSRPEPAVEEAKAPTDAAQVTPEAKPVSGTKPTRKVVRRTVVRKVSASAGASSRQTPKSAEAGKAKVQESAKTEVHDVDSANTEEPVSVDVEESAKKEESTVRNSEGSTKEDHDVANVEESAKEVQDVDSSNKEELVPADVEESAKKEEPTVKNAEGSAKKEEPTVENAEGSAKKEEPTVENAEGSTKKDHGVANVEESSKKEEVTSEAEKPLIEIVGESTKQKDPVVADVLKLSENQESSIIPAEEEVNEEMEEAKTIENRLEPEIDPDKIEENINEELKGEDAQLMGDAYHGDEKMEECGNEEVHEELGEDDLVQDDVAEHGEEAEALEEERAQLNAIVKERKIKKELEIFVGGLDRDAVEDDVKKAFNNVGEVVEVRLHKDPSTNKNKGYAFVRFATKEQATRALSEMKNPVICGKRCGTALNEDNDTLFLGNICNTWTKEAIKQKLKDFGLEGVENITLVPDAQHEGLSRGFAFIEFSCHADAMLAYKRLQKPDVIFGHPERTARVAFAEPLREPDPEVMAQVKSVFVDGLPPYWDEDRVREKFKCYGEIIRIMLARNMSTSKRKDFGFVDFTTHEAAVACIEGVNNTELGDGNSKTKVRVRLSNPMPKTQAVKGGICGGFRIGHGSDGTFSRIGRGFGRGGHTFGRANFQRGRGFYQYGRGQAGRMGFANEPDFGSPYPPFQGRQNFGRGGRWGSFRGAHQASGRGAVPARTNLDRHRHLATDRGHADHVPFRRQPFTPEEGFNRSFMGRQFNDPYFYDDNAHGIKRPFFMTDQDPDYMGPSRVRPRLDYSDPTVSIRGSRYPDTSGAGTFPYSHDHYGSDYGRGAYSSFYDGDRPYGGRYYY